MATPRKETKIRKGIQEMDKITDNVMNGNPHTSNILDRVGEIFDNISDKTTTENNANVKEDAKVRTDISNNADKRLGDIMTDKIHKCDYAYVMLRSTGMPSYKAGVIAYDEFRFHKWGVDVLLDAKVKMIFNKKENKLRDAIKEHSTPAISEVDINRVERYMFDSLYEDMQTADPKDKTKMMDTMTKIIKNISDREGMQQQANSQPFILQLTQNNNAIPTALLNNEDPIINVNEVLTETMQVDEDPCV